MLPPAHRKPSSFTIRSLFRKQRPANTKTSHSSAKPSSAPTSRLPPPPPHKSAAPQTTSHRLAGWFSRSIFEKHTMAVVRFKEGGWQACFSRELIPFDTCFLWSFGLMGCMVG